MVDYIKGGKRWKLCFLPGSLMLSGKFTYLLLLKLLLLSFSNITCSCFDPSVDSVGIVQVFSSRLDFWDTQLHGLQDSQPLQYETVLCRTNVWTKLLPLSGVPKITTGVPVDSSPSLIGGEVEPVPFPLPTTCVQFCPNYVGSWGRVKCCKCGRTRGRASTQP